MTPSHSDRSGRPAEERSDRFASGGSAWTPPLDATPERTAVALARWQRRRTARALLGLPLNEIGPRDGVAAAVMGGVLLGIVARVITLTMGAIA